ncbi:thermonuclease family protein, partial [Mycolicibacterium obuense]
VEPAQPHHVDHPTAVNRTLAYVEKAGGWDFSVEAARAGAAKSYVYGRRPATLTPQIRAAEAEAQRTQRGLWGPPCYGHTDSTPVK